MASFCELSGRRERHGLVDKCEAATGWKWTATRRHLRLMFPVVVHTTSARGRRSKLNSRTSMETVVLSSTPHTADSRTKPKTVRSAALHGKI
jgi:hypothetical protein